MLEAKVSPVVGRTQRQRDGKKKLKKRSQNPPLPPDKTIETARFFAALPSDASATAWARRGSLLSRTKRLRWAGTRFHTSERHPSRFRPLRFEIVARTFRFFSKTCYSCVLPIARNLLISVTSPSPRFFFYYDDSCTDAPT